MPAQVCTAAGCARDAAAAIAAEQSAQAAANAAAQNLTAEISRALAAEALKIPLSALNTPGGPPTQDSRGTLSGQTFIATGATFLRSFGALATDAMNVRSFGAICDGNSHTLSSLGYSTLAAAQAFYPAAFALTDEADGDAILQALAARGATGGSALIDAASKCVVNQNVLMPEGSGLKGTLQLRGQPSASTLLAQGSAIYLESGAQIQPQSSTSIEGLLVQRKGVTYTEADASAFSGTAISSVAGSNDIAISGTLVAGFQNGIVIPSGGRIRLENDYVDAQSCVSAGPSGDTSRYLHVHCWPFVTAGSPNLASATGNDRTGMGFYVYGLQGGTVIDDVLAFQHHGGGVVIGPSAGNFSLSHLYIDGQARAPLVLATGTASFSGSTMTLTAAPSAPIVLGMPIVASGVPANTTVEGVTGSGASTVAFLSNSVGTIAAESISAYETEYGLWLQPGSEAFSVTDADIYGQQVGVFHDTGIIGPNLQNIRVHGSYYDNYQIKNGVVYGTDWLADTPGAPNGTTGDAPGFATGSSQNGIVVFGNSTLNLKGFRGHGAKAPAGACDLLVPADDRNITITDYSTDFLPTQKSQCFAGSLYPAIAAADPLQLPMSGDTFIVTGTTNFGTLTSFFPGRRITFYVQSGLTINNGSAFTLKDGANAVLPAGSVIEFLSTAGGLTEVARTLPSTLAWTSSASIGQVPSVGTITSSTGVMRYQKVGRTVTVNIDINIATNGAGSGQVLVTLPFANNATSTSIISGRETNVTGNALVAQVAASSSTLIIETYNNAYPGGNGYQLVLNGSYEAAN